MAGAFDEGFLFDELSEVKQDLLRSVNEIYPKETDKFIKGECRKLLKVTKNVAKSEVGTSKGIKKDWIASKSYHNNFKVGKIYDYAGDKCCRVYNSSPHAHLIEYGHINIPRGQKRATTRAGRREQTANRKATSFTEGKLIFDIASFNFQPEYFNDIENFLAEYLGDTMNGNF